MADTISIDMANVLSYLRKRRADVHKCYNVTDPTDIATKHYFGGQQDAYDDALEKIVQVLNSHARSWAKFARSLEQQVAHERTD